MAVLCSLADKQKSIWAQACLSLFKGVRPDCCCQDTMTKAVRTQLPTQSHSARGRATGCFPGFISLLRVAVPSPYPNLCFPGCKGQGACAVPARRVLAGRRCFSKPCSQLWHLEQVCWRRTKQWQQEQSIASASLGFCLEDAQSVLSVHEERMSSNRQSWASSLPLHSPGPWKTTLMKRPPAWASSFRGPGASWVAGLFGRQQAESVPPNYATRWPRGNLSGESSAL